MTKTCGPAEPSSASALDISFTSPPERALTGAELAEIDLSPRFRIGEVAKRIGLSVRSIRYYEEAGLITPAGRTSGGFRMYSEVDVQRLLSIMQMKPLDFTLEAMRTVLNDLDTLRDAEAEPSQREAARERLSAVTKDVDLRWETLQRKLTIADVFRSLLRTELATGAEGAADSAD
ncbi:MerR family transcriptional regulator [Gephyromycinifex aptenodytis]|uniref:MerR family transcriptional regulator n=1 Tax=Gephyromycinifex aptenodytis TaxID=2716227 RepID=UPI0029CA86AB|nr:MerR family transcriptional regulator [Gephyromycinifex aptenodytis]